MQCREINNAGCDAGMNSCDVRNSVDVRQPVAIRIWRLLQLILECGHCPETLLCGRVMRVEAGNWSWMDHGHVRFEQEHIQADATKFEIMLHCMVSDAKV